MFLPPEQRHPGSSPGDTPPSKPTRPARGDTLVPWLIGLMLVSTVVAPLGGSSLLEALWYLVRR